MSKRKYSFEKMSQEELKILQEKYPKSVQAVTHLKPVYSVIAKLLDCDLEVPGLRLRTEEETAELPLAEPEESPKKKAEKHEIQQ